ncbi:MAG: PQQ-dependent dehydrogenase, methanol/ethanol family [Xanthobacteraceae bacterium]
MMRSIIIAAALSTTLPLAALAQSSDDLKNSEKTPNSVLIYAMGYSANRYSPLTQINTENVKRLVPVWSYSVSDLHGGEDFPVVNNGVIYVTTHDSTAAVDALTGQQIWRVKHNYPPETLRVVCCGIVNRGAAIYDGMIIRALMDDRIVALDAKTGKQIWEAKSPDPATPANGYAMTGAPLIVNGIVIVGVAGAEFSNRGFIEAYDAKTGKHLWRDFTIPAKGEPGADTWQGDSYLTGGGSSWVTGSYDPNLDLVFWGVGNPAPWNPRARAGDNLFTNSVWAIRPETGERVWYYQASPHDPFDYDAVGTPINATLNVRGTPEKVVIQANRNGFLYVLDAKTGKLLAANPFGKVNWASAIDMKTGRPVYTDVYKGAISGEKVTVWPSVSGVTNWQGFSYSPHTGLCYINIINVGMTYQAPEPTTLKPGQPSGVPTVKRSVVTEDPNVRGYLEAIDPLTGTVKWKTPYRSPNFSSTMSTASDLVFTGTMTGEFEALDANSGKLLWSFQTPSGIVGQPVTWEKDGRQYVTIMSGLGGVYALHGGDPNLQDRPTGMTLMTFALFDK